MRAELARRRTWLAAALLAAGWGVYAWLDSYAAVTVRGALWPLAVGWGAYVTAAVLLALHPCAWRTRAAAVAAVALALAAVQPIDWNSRKPFLRALERVRPGLTVAEVDTLMAGYPRGPAAPGTAAERGVVAYRHTEEGWGNADVGLVRFAGGRVARVEFLPD